MSSWRTRALRSTADLEDDIGGGTMHVFVPSIMGVGILASLAILVADGLRALSPRRSAARRRALARRRAVAMVAPLAAAIGLPPPTLPPERRQLRSRRSYAALSVLSVGMSLYVAVGSTANYQRSGGYLEGVVWMQVLAMSASLFFLGIGVVAIAVALRYPAGPRWAHAVVDHSPLGVREE